MSAEDNSWRTPSFRQNVVQKIEDAVRSSGMNPSKNSLEMENHVFQKAKSKEDYLSYVARLILHVREMNAASRFLTFLDSHVFKKGSETPEAIKEQGNIFFTRKMYSEALIFYNKAIEMNSSSALFYGNRTACYVMMGDYKKAIDDARISVRLDPSFTKGWARVTKCCIALGEGEAASEALNKLLSLDPSNDSAKNDKKNLELLQSQVSKVIEAMEKKDYSHALTCINSALTIATASNTLKCLKAECLVNLKQYESAQKLANEFAHSDNTGASYIYGLCNYYQGNLELAITFFSDFQARSSDKSKVKGILNKALSFQRLKAEGNTLFKQNNYRNAHNLYTSALQIDPTNSSMTSKLYFNRGTANFNLNNMKEALNDYSKAIQLDDKYVKAFSRRGQCYMKLNESQKAVYDFEKVFRAEPTIENKRFLDDAKAALNRSKRKDYYKLLEITASATLDEIKKAYRKRALIHHPDRHVNSSEDEKIEEEKKFKEIGEAYTILSDPVKRADYDRTIMCFNPHIHHNAAAAAAANVTTFVNRATSFISKGNFAQARDAAVEAINRDPNCLGAYLCLVKCHIATGSTAQAESLFIQLRKSSKFHSMFHSDWNILNRLKLLMTHAENHLKASYYDLAKNNINEAQKLAPASDVLKLWKAECLIYTNQLDSVSQLINSINLPDGHHLVHHLTYIKGLFHYIKGDMQQAIFILNSQSMRISSTIFMNKCCELSKRANQLNILKEKANNAYSKDNLKEALDLYSKTLAIDKKAKKFNSVIYANRGAAYYKLQKFKECIVDCTQALKLDSVYEKALLRRAQCYTELNCYVKAIADYERLYGLSRNPDHRNLLEKVRQKAGDNDDSVLIIEGEDEEEESEPEKPRSKPKQTKISDYITGGRRNLRTRTQKNYRIDSDSDKDEAPATKKSKLESSEESEESSEEEVIKKNRTSRATSSKKSEPPPKSRGAQKQGKNTTATKQSQKPKTSRKIQSESESSASVSSAGESDQSSPESELSDSEELFVKKTVGGKKNKVSLDSDSDSDSDGEDLSKIKNSYRSRTVSQSTKKFYTHKYKKVVGGKKK